MKFSHKLMSLVMAFVMMIGSVSMVASGASTFTDFPTGSWSEPALNAAVANSLLKGRPDNTIGPKDYITRAETATVINRAFGAEVKADISAYTDVSPSDWHYGEIQKAVNMRTLNGVSDSLIMPDAYITREQVFAILARALVLSDTDETKLSSFADGGAVSLWARSYTAALVNRGYVNGDNSGMLNPGAYITREEFAQVMYNIFKKYIQSEEDGINDATYGMTLVRGDNLTLKNLVINGDLVVGDGVKNIVLDSVKVSGRILFRGGHGKVKIEKNCSVGEFVLVNNVNGVVNFQNYETESIFKNKVLNTKATFLKPSGGGSYIGEKTKDYTITIYKQKLTDKAYEDTFTYDSEITPVTDENGKSITYTPETIDGFTVDESISTLSGTNDGSLEIKVYYKRNVYTITFDGKEYKAYYGQKLGEAGYKDGGASVLLADVLHDYTAPEGYENKGFVVGTTSVDKDTVIDKTIFATQSVEIKPVDEELFYDIIYDANGGTIDGLAVKTIEDGVSGAKKYTLLNTSTATLAREDYTFGGWYLDAECQIGPVDTISKGSVPSNGTSYKYYARWIPDGASILGFSFDKNESAKTLTVYVTLTKIPEDVNSLSGITVNWSAIPKYATGKKFKFVSAEGIVEAGTNTGFEFTDGKIAWLNLNAPVTEEKLTNAGGKLFKITYEYEDGVGDVNFAYNDAKTQLGYYNGYSYDLVMSKKYTTDKAVALFDIGYTVTVYEQDILNRPEDVPTYIAGTPDAKKGATDASVDCTSYTAPEGFKINAVSSVLSGINNGSLEIKIYLDRETYQMNFNGSVYKFLYGQYLFKGTNGDGDALKKAMDDYKEDKKAQGIEVKFTYADGSEIDFENDVAGKDIQNIETVETAQYTITIYKQKLTDKAYEDTFTYDSETTPVTDENGKSITYTPETIDGFTVDESISTLSGANSGSLEIKVYYKRNVYTFTFGGKEYKAYYGQKLGEAGYKDGGVNVLLADVLYDYTAPEGYENKGFVVGTTSVDKDTVIDKTIFATQSVEIKPVDEELFYDIIYDANGGTIDGLAVKTIEDGVSGAKAYTLLTVETATLAREGYTFGGWYLDAECQIGPVETISKGSVPSNGTSYKYYANWIPDEPSTYRVTLHNGMNDANPGYYDVEAGAKLTQSQVDLVLGTPDTYPVEYGYTDSNGNPHEIRANLWYKVGDDWKVYVPEKVAINKDTDVYLLTSYVGVYYDTNIEVKGYKIPELQLVIPYDTSTELFQSGLDMLTALGSTIESVLYDVEKITGKDLFKGALEKASKLGLTDADGNILNPEIVVPLSKLITEKRIMDEIDSYIDENIDNEDFIADILRNDHVVDVLLGDENIKTTILSDKEKRDKLLTIQTIKTMLENDELVEWIIAREDFVESLLENDATIDYIVDDLENLLNDPAYSDFILNACVEFVVDVYFTPATDPNFIDAPELVEYIDEVLTSPDLIDDIEGDASLKPYFKDEVKGLLSRLHTLPDDDEEKSNVYATIRENEDFRKEIIKALKGNNSVMTLIRNDVKEDLKKATDDDDDTISKYASVVVNAVREEFANDGSPLKASIISQIKTDLKKGALSTLKPTVVAAIETDLAKGDSSTLRPIIIKEIEDDIALGDESLYKATIVDIIVTDVALGDESEYKATIVEVIEDDLALGASSEFKPIIVEAIEEDFIKPSSELKDSIIASVIQDFNDTNSTLHDAVVTTIKTEISVAGSDLRELILDKFENPSSARYESIKAHLMGSSAIRDEIKAVAKDNVSVQDSVKTFLTTETNLTDSLKAEMLAAIKTDADALAVVIMSADSSIDPVEAEELAQDYIGNNLEDSQKSELDDKIDDLFDDTALLASTIDANFDTIYSAAYDDLFDNMYTDDDVFDSAYAIYASDRQNIEKAFDSYVSDTVNLNEAIENFVADADDLEEAVNVYASTHVADAVDLYIGLSGNISEAITYYIKDEGRVSKAVDVYIKDQARLSDAIDFCLENGTGISKAIDLYIENATDADIEKAINIYIGEDDYLLRAVNNYIAEDAKLIEVFNLVETDDEKLMDAFEVYVAADPNSDADAIAQANDNLDSAFKKLTESGDFDTFYDTHFGGDDSALFNKVFEIYYLANVHHAAQVAYDNVNFNATVMGYLKTYTKDLLNDYASGNLALTNSDLSDAIDKIMAEDFPGIIRNEYRNDPDIKDTIDNLVSSKGRELIEQYTEGTLGNDDLETLINTTVLEKIDIVVEEYIDGELDADIKAIVDKEINEYTEKLVNDYISDVGDARETLGELIPTYAHNAVDALKATDGFKNTIKDFTSGRDVRVNENNIMFISIISDLMGEYDYDKIMKDFAPEKLVKLVDKLKADDVARKYVNGMLDDFVEGVKSAEEKLNADIDNEIEGTEYTFSTNIPVNIAYMSDIIVPAYDKAMAKITGKLKSKELIAKNPVAMKLINKNWILELLDYDADKVSSSMSGYSIKKGEYDEEYDYYGSPIMTYYNIFLDNTVLLHDAIMWYGDNVSEATMEQKLDAVSNLIGVYANKANDAVMEYINTGVLPKGYTPEEIANKILDKVLGVNGKIDTAYEKIEDLYFAKEDKILSIIDKAKNFYEDRLNKDYKEVVDLANLSIYADNKAYPIYKTLLEMHGEGEAFNIDALSTAIFDSDNYHGINKVETLMSKVKSKLSRFKDNPVSEIRIFRNAYKVSVGPREIKGYGTGIHTFKLQRFLR